jgi:hypothetical protein
MNQHRNLTLIVIIKRHNQQPQQPKQSKAQGSFEMSQTTLKAKLILLNHLKTTIQILIRFYNHDHQTKDYQSIITVYCSPPKKEITVH